MHGVFIAKTNLNIEPQTIFTEVVDRPVLQRSSFTWVTVMWGENAK